jgi:hypothetical protein
MQALKAKTATALDGDDDKASDEAEFSRTRVDLIRLL